MDGDAGALPRLDFAWAGSTRVPAGATYGPYTTVYWEFIWCLDGAARVLSGEQAFELEAGAVQLTPPGTRNHYAWHPVTGTSYGYAIFTMPREHPDWPRFRPARSEDIIVPLLDHVLWLDSSHPPGWRESATIALGYAIRAFAGDASATRLAHGQHLPEVIIRSLDAVRRRGPDGHGQPTLGELAASAGVTGEYLCRVYARHVGMGPVSAIRALRLHRAAQLLSSTNLGVAEIAGRLGYASEFHFSRSFRRFAGSSPSGFRNDPDARVELPVELRRLEHLLRTG